MFRTLRCLLPVLACLVVAPLAVAQDVHVVDDDGPADFIDLPAAIAAAAPGDTLLVQPGSYSAFTLSKSLTITAEADLTADVGGILVAGLAPADRVVLRGLVVGPAAPSGLVLTNSAGWIGLEDCVYDGGGSVIVSVCAAASLVRCDVTSSGADGLSSSLSSTFLFETDVQGGKVGAEGAAGVRQSGGFLFVEGGTIRGGDGTDGTGTVFGCIFEPGDGGDGIESISGASVLTLQGATVLPGDGGATPSSCSASSDGAAQAGPFASVTDHGGTHHGLDVETPVRMGTLAENVLTGEPGDVAILAIGVAPTSLYLPPWGSVLSVDQLALVQVAGTVPASGSLTFQVLVPILAAVESIQLWEQAAFVPASGTLSLGAPSFPVVLSPAF